MNSKPFLIKSDGSVPALSAEKANPFKVGDILVGCYGYEASIAVWAKVLKVNAQSIVIVELEGHNYDYHTGGMYWTSKPSNVESSKHMTKKVHDGRRIKWSSYCSLWKWDGKPIECYNVH